MTSIYPALYYITEFPLYNTKEYDDYLFSKVVAYMDNISTEYASNNTELFRGVYPENLSSNCD